MIIASVPGNRIHVIVNGTRDITGDTDLRLGKFFGLSEGYFLRLQNAYDTLEAKRRIVEQVPRSSPTNRVKRPRPMKAATLAWYSNEGGRNICIGVFLARRSVIKELT